MVVDEAGRLRRRGRRARADLGAVRPVGAPVARPSSVRLGDRAGGRVHGHPVVRVMAWGLDFLVAASSALILTAAVLLLNPSPARVRERGTDGRDPVASRVTGRVGRTPSAEAADAASGQAWARSSTSSRTRAASAWPFIAFMTAPMTAPAACTLPSRIFASTSGCEASASSIAAMSAPSSETTASPRASTTSCGVPSPGDDALEHLAGELVGERARRRRAPASAATSRGRRRASAASRPCAFAMRVISPVHHLRAAAGVAPAATVASTSASRPPFDDVLELEVGEAPLGLQPAAARGRRLGQRGAQLLDELGATARRAAGRARGSSGSRRRRTSGDPAMSCRCPRASAASPA